MMCSLDIVLRVREELGDQTAQANIIVNDENRASLAPVGLYAESSFTADWVVGPYAAVILTILKP